MKLISVSTDLLRKLVAGQLCLSVRRNAFFYWEGYLTSSLLHKDNIHGLAYLFPLVSIPHEDSPCHYDVADCYSTPQALDLRT